MKKKTVRKAAKAVTKPQDDALPSDIEEFQEAYGPEWLKIVQSAPFKAGLLLLNIRKLDSVTALSNDQIEKNGREILADLRGHMILENDLMTLHNMKESGFMGDETEEYFSPEQVAELEMQKERFRELNKKTRYG